MITMDKTNREFDESSSSSSSDDGHNKHTSQVGKSNYLQVFSNLQ